MQLHAFDSNGQLITARKANKQLDYYCLECRQAVRMRGGPQRRCHFYHLDPTPFCRQHQKGPIHLQLQSYILDQLPPGDCSLEFPFPSIRRIADVAWLSQKIVFEIQFSAISAKEVLARNRDYQESGWTVVWILHDHRYNQIRLSEAEMALRLSPHFFSNMDSSGEGMIYDQFDLCEKGMRRERLAPLPINLKENYRKDLSVDSSPSALLNQRMSHWKLSFCGDLLSLFYNNPSSNYLRQAIEMESRFYSGSHSLNWRHILMKTCQNGIVRPYQTFFRFLLERMCR